MIVIKNVLAVLLLAFLIGCEGKPQEFSIGEVTKTDFAPLKVECDTDYVPEDLTEWTYSLPDDAVLFQNAKMLANNQAGLTGSFNYSLWLRDEMARQCILTNLVSFTDQYGNDNYAVEYNGWVAVQAKSFVGHPRDIKFAVWHELGFPDGTWVEIAARSAE